MLKSTLLRQSANGVRPTFWATVGIYLGLLGLVVVIGMPFFWMLVTSIKPLDQVFDVQQVLPAQPDWATYGRVWQRLPLGRYVFNSAFTASVIAAGQLLLGVPAAYAFARLVFPGRDAVFLLLLATMMIPVQVTFIPSFVLISRLGWRDTYWALTVPFFASAFGIFLLRQAFRQIPQDYLDAARLDGCGTLGLLRHVCVPMSAATIATFVVFSFVGHYNDLFWPLIATDSDTMRTIAVGLTSFIDYEGGTRWNELLAASVIGIAPLIGLFLVAQRFFVDGLLNGGLKG